MSKLLVIGPLTNKKNPSKTGGAVVLFENLIERLNESKIDYTLIDTNKENYKNTYIAYIAVIFQLIYKQFGKTHISLHSSRDYLIFAPIVIFVSKVFNKKCSLRKFGGEAFEHYSQAKGTKKKILNFIFKNIDYLFLEMKYLVENFKPINQNTFWFPNVRNNNDLEIKQNTYSKKFIFISQVKYEKGIDEIINAFKLLDNTFNIDIYGPIVDKKYSEDTFKKFGNINYKGALNSNEVLKTLNNNDILVLPTFYEGEGYPGIIIESYSVSKPVISTKWKGIVEIVDKKTGILIEPKNTNELVNAIKYFNEDNYLEFSKNAKEKFKEFNSEIQTKKFLNTIGIN
jgi:glycosyltransferase involved in cell wall biosynthesis